ncbi:MAG: calcium-binding protein [Minisyncoccia bacterium]
MEGQDKNSGIIAGTVVALVVAVAAYGFYTYTKKEGDTSMPVVVNAGMETSATPTALPKVVATEPVATPRSFKYKDGTYNAIGNYTSPGGSEEVGVSVTLKSDVITDATLEVKATRPISKNMQTVVLGEIKSLVVGKKLDEVVLSKVSGSSLTPKGWNDAISKIQVSAKA